MTTPHDDDQADDQHEGDPEFMRKLRAEAKTGREAQKAIEEANAATRAAQRELAMARAGIDITAPLGAMFAKAYDGEVDVDQIKSEWGKLQPDAEGTPQVGVSAADRAAMERISAAQAGGTPAGGAPHDFQGELDAIPMVTDGNYNPDYVTAVLKATQVQAAREGRQFETSKGDISWAKDGPGPVPVTNPL